MYLMFVFPHKFALKNIVVFTLKSVFGRPNTRTHVNVPCLHTTSKAIQITFLSDVIKQYSLYTSTYKEMV